MHATVDGEVIDGNGSTFEFGDTEVQWSDLCNSFVSRFDQPDAASLRLEGGSAAAGPRSAPGWLARWLGALSTGGNDGPLGRRSRRAWPGK